MALIGGGPGGTDRPSGDKAQLYGKIRQAFPELFGSYTEDDLYGFYKEGTLLKEIPKLETVLREKEKGLLSTKSFLSSREREEIDNLLKGVPESGSTGQPSSPEEVYRALKGKRKHTENIDEAYAFIRKDLSEAYGVSEEDIDKALKEERFPTLEMLNDIEKVPEDYEILCTIGGRYKAAGAGARKEPEIDAIPPAGAEGAGAGAGGAGGLGGPGQPEGLHPEEGARKQPRIMKKWLYRGGIAAGILAAGVAGYIAYNALVSPSYDKPEAGNKYLVEKVVLDGGKDIPTNEETTGWYLLKVKKIGFGKDSETVGPGGRKYKIESIKGKATAQDVPYKLIILGHNKPLKELKIGGQNIDEGRIIETKGKFIDNYMDNKDGIRKFVYPMDRVEIDDLSFWEVKDPKIPKEAQRALDP